MVAMVQRALTDKTKIQTLWKDPSGSQQWLEDGREELEAVRTDIISLREDLVSFSVWPALSVSCPTH